MNALNISTFFNETILVNHSNNVYPNFRAYETSGSAVQSNISTCGGTYVDGHVNGCGVSSLDNDIMFILDYI